MGDYPHHLGGPIKARTYALLQIVGKDRAGK